jgi:hypothetical protein
MLQRETLLCINCHPGGDAPTSSLFYNGRQPTMFDARIVVHALARARPGEGTRALAREVAEGRRSRGLDIELPLAIDAGLADEAASAILRDEPDASSPTAAAASRCSTAQSETAGSATIGSSTGSG